MKKTFKDIIASDAEVTGLLTTLRYWCINFHHFVQVNLRLTTVGSVPFCGLYQSLQTYFFNEAHKICFCPKTPLSIININRDMKKLFGVDPNQNLVDKINKYKDYVGHWRGERIGHMTTYDLMSFLKKNNPLCTSENNDMRGLVATVCVYLANTLPFQCGLVLNNNPNTTVQHRDAHCKAIAFMDIESQTAVAPFWTGK